MRQLKIPLNQFDPIIEQLQEENFFNEGRYTECYVRSHFEKKKWGKTKIKFNLYQKNIPPNLVHKSLEGIDLSSYQNTLKKLGQKKIKILEEKDNSTFEIKQKTLAYLNQKGYEIELIKDFLDDLIK